MVLVLDVGNTNIKVGVFIDGKLKHSWRMSTSIEQIWISERYPIQIKHKYLDYF